MSTHAIIGEMLQIGDQFDQYQITAHIAQGGMSDVYKAIDAIKHREVAIKIPERSIIGDPAQYERFQRELEILNTLDHPAVLKGLGTGKYNRMPYLVTALVDGQSLRTLIETSAPLAVDRAVTLTRKIAEGMAYCHQNDVVHRDLKPENILVTKDGQPIIMDFGLALTKSAHRVTYSNLSATMGTPDYMAPEQIEGQRGDARTDVYALGTILYEMLSGRTPFVGDNQLAIMEQHLRGVPPPLEKLNPQVSVQLAAIVSRALLRDPERRYADMNAFIEALDHPEAADLKVKERNESTSFWRFQGFKAVGLGLGIFVALILLAVLLQTLK